MRAIRAPRRASRRSPARSSAAARRSTPTASQSAKPNCAAAMAAAQLGFADWDAVGVDRRAAALERAGDLLEARRGALIALMAREGGKTIDDGVAEVREAVDFCRYYAG